MASKKYLGLDEVAARLGVASDQVNKLREEGRLRGFADRGTWKFKSDDVEEFARSRQADSAPDVPILDLPLDDEAIVSPSGIRRGGSAVSDDDGVGEQPTVIRGDMTGSSILDEEPLLNASDSDVRLILDDSLVGGDSAPEVDVQADSDSDVRLMDPKAAGRAAAKPAGRSDSDVKLISDDGDTVSDVRLLSGDDVPLAKSGSDSDVALVSPSKGGTSVFDDEEELRPLAADSGIALEHIADSGISLDAPSTAGRGSGVLLEDSVVVGPGGESSIISLADSGISLDEPKKRGSGIQLGGQTDSGIALEALGDGGATMPMMRATGGRGDAGEDTQFEVEAAGDSEFELAMSGEVGTGNDTSVILLEEEDSFVAQPPSSRKGARKQPAVEQFVAAEGDDVVEIEDDFDAFDEEGGSAVAVSDEDEDLEFEAADEDFDEGFQTGESQADFAPAGQRVVVAAEPEFGMPTVVGLGATSLLLALCGMMMFDLVRSMWGYNDPTLSSWLLDSTKGLF